MSVAVQIDRDVRLPDHEGWAPRNWRRCSAAQQPPWPGHAHPAVIRRIRTYPPLVTPGEIDWLTQELASVAAGEAFVLQVGDCAERFSDVAATTVPKLCALMHELADELYEWQPCPVVPIGRLAGQYAKPRSAPTERIDGLEVPSYRGDIINDLMPTPASRRPDSLRLVAGYFRAQESVETLRIQAAVAGVTRANPASFRSPVAVARALGYAVTQSVDPPALWTSHEALLLDYEDALTYRDTATGRIYLCSTHFPWIGDRTRAVTGAHVEFASGLANPLAVKIGPTADAADVVALCQRLDPHRTPGRLTLVTRLGAQRIEQTLPPLIKAVRAGGFPVSWVCDPMHGNTFKTHMGIKTRSVEDVAAEVAAFLRIHQSLDSWPGGLHLEATADNVTECLGGPQGLTLEDLRCNYRSSCDPRLNHTQALALLRLVAKRMVPHAH